jgi:hypothetical protein
MRQETIVLHSALPLAEFESRLHSVVDRETFWNQGLFVFFSGDNPVTGKFSGNRFRLNRKRYFVNNGFARMFYGRYEPEAGGIRIEGRFDVYPFAKWFMRVWLGFAVLISVLSYSELLKDLASGARSFSDLSPLHLIPLGFVLYGILFPRLGQWMSRGSEQFILDYLEDNLTAHMGEDLALVPSAPTGLRGL